MLKWKLKKYNKVAYGYFFGDIMKKIFILIFLGFLSFEIYQITFKKEKLIFSIGNTTGHYFYAFKDLTITDVTMAISRNEEIQNRPIQNLLVKSSLIQIDLSKMVSIESYNSVYTELEDMEELILLIRKYTKEKVEVLLLPEENDIAEYMNQKISILCKKYDIIISR